MANPNGLPPVPAEVSIPAAEMIKEVARTKEFTGHRGSDLTSFIREVEMLLPLFDHNPQLKHYIFNRHIITKIQGPALQAIRTLGPNATWPQIKSELVRNFGVKETYYTLHQNAIATKNTNVSQYFNILKDVLDKLNIKYEFDETKPQAENLIRLQSCLKGKAREMVRSRLMLPEMVPEIINTLRMVYGRPELIVENLINKARKVPKLSDKLESLVDFALVVRNIFATMESCDLKDYMNNPMLVRELVEKLPNQHKYNWAMLPKDNSMPVLKIFSDWLYTQAQEISKVLTPSPGPRNAVVNTHVREDKQQRSTCCPYCKDEDHNRVADCNKFRGLRSDEKWTVVRNLKLCKQCLNIHRRRCFIMRSCGVNGCTIKHHQLLHNQGAVSQDLQRNAVGVCNSHHTGDRTDKPYFRILPVRLFGENNFIDTFAFLDEGSSVTLIEEDTFKSLGLSGTKEPLCLRWTGDKMRTEETSVRAKFEIANAFTGERFVVKDVGYVNSDYTKSH